MRVCERGLPTLRQWLIMRAGSWRCIAQPAPRPRSCPPPFTHAHTHTNTQVTWQPPSKNSERITAFKLMAATSTGVVREVYGGKGLSAKAGGLRENAEYVFCVKATYDDGSFLWSDSRAFCTK